MTFVKKFGEGRGGPQFQRVFHTQYGNLLLVTICYLVFATVHSGHRSSGMERVTAQCHLRAVPLFILMTSENFSVSATTAWITLITVSWSWNACTQHHHNPGELNWTEHPHNKGLGWPWDVYFPFLLHLPNFPESLQVKPADPNVSLKRICCRRISKSRFPSRHPINHIKALQTDNITYL